MRGMNLAGHVLRKYVPFLPGVRAVRVTEWRAPLEGEFFLSGTEVVKRVGRATLSVKEQAREEWIVEIVNPGAKET